jgi:tetratricopeptide (TPR) repeat protein
MSASGRSIPLSKNRALLSAAALAALVALSAIVFSPALRGEFVSDDRNAIVSNGYVTGGASAAEIFSNYSWWGAERADAPGYRPLVTWTFARTHDLYGLSVYPYHLTNLLLHGLVGWLVLLLACRLGAAPAGAAGAAALFVVLPIHTEAVAWVVGRAELLAAAGFAGALLAAIDFRTKGGPVRAALAGTLLSAALLSKENAITLLALPVFLAALYPRDRTRPLAGASRDVVVAGALLAGVAAYFAARAAAEGPFFPDYRPDLLDNPLSAAGPWARATGALSILGRYLVLTVWPARMSIDYSYDATGIGPAFSGDAYALLALGAIAGLVWAGYRTYRDRPIVAFGLLTAAATYSIVSNTVLPIGTLMGERLFYLPTLGLCLAASPLFETVAKAFTPRVAAGVAALPLIAYAAVSYQRAEVWRSPVTLFEAAADAYPRSARAHMELGSAYGAAGRADDAEVALEKAMDIHPEYGAAAYNLGNLYARTGRFDDAVRIYETALEHSPNLVQAWYNLGLVLGLQNRPQDAVRALGRAAEIAPNDPLSQQAFGDALLRVGRNEDAVSAYERALGAGAPASVAGLNRGVARERAFGCDAALEDYLAVLRGDPQNRTARQNAVSCLQRTGRHDEALRLSAEGP